MRILKIFLVVMMLNIIANSLEVYGMDLFQSLNMKNKNFQLADKIYTMNKSKIIFTNVYKTYSELVESWLVKENKSSCHSLRISHRSILKISYSRESIKKYPKIYYPNTQRCLMNEYKEEQKRYWQKIKGLCY